MLISPTNTASFPVPHEWNVEPDFSAVPAARRSILEIARFWKIPLSDDALRDVELCASEVLANAIEHTGQRCRVKVRWTGERLRVEVADASLRLPDSGAAPDPITGGRGLLLVENLAHSWGWYPQGAGKVVWFECAADQQVARDSRLALLVQVAHAQAADHLTRSA
ncbi:ATP-binding protein [Kitasatospora sp. DSM 101779]|uniref:ATP-binding protein n=1 Tax=Kitasatospora sp. DSM 101779 TaxID=2853165 RepID=UPI0021D89A62|nr:ATP-binding protein [Kitasatospora sp. DSM 101779]MCU7823592.1 ATP-binding protein [Kitasatospora sp. DSM 101779]